MKFTAFLRDRELFIPDGNGHLLFSDFLYGHEDTVTATRVLEMYGYRQVSDWRRFTPGIMACQVDVEREKV